MIVFHTVCCSKSIYMLSKSKLLIKKTVYFVCADKNRSINRLVFSPWCLSTADSNTSPSQREQMQDIVHLLKFTVLRPLTQFPIIRLWLTFTVCTSGFLPCLKKDICSLLCYYIKMYIPDFLSSILYFQFDVYSRSFL